MSLPYDKRAGCHNFGTSGVCPIGVRYAPTHHLIRAVATGRCKVHLTTSVRRVVVDGRGRPRRIHQHHDARMAQEHAAKIVTVGANVVRGHLNQDVSARRPS